MRPVTIVIVLFLTACAGDNSPAHEASVETAATAPVREPSPSPTFATAKALLDTDEGSLLLDVELAVNDQQRAFGLTHRSSLEPERGMAFLFFRETSRGFPNQNLLFPVSIAFFGRDGTILEILEMEPCPPKPCKAYDPGVSYFGALQVNRGAFERWDVDEGDRIHIPQ